MAFQSLAANRARAMLTMLGIIIGVAAVITMTAIGQGAQQTIANQQLLAESPPALAAAFGFLKRTQRHFSSRLI
jgi:ABC-type lipoprotein release transport system permease subunit